jgi:hypothetical protein
LTLLDRDPSLPQPDRPAKFADPDWTAGGQRRASVELNRIETVWFNTGTLCNLACPSCYIESSPSNDRLLFLSRAEVRAVLEEAAAFDPPPREIGFTGGEPFANRDIAGMIEDALGLGFSVLVLTNAMTPLKLHRAALLRLQAAFPGRLTLRVSLDHYDPARHEAMRGPGSWAPAIAGLSWLAEHGFAIAIAGRTASGEPEAELRAGYAALFAGLGLALDATDSAALVLFPEMTGDDAVPEISEACWGILNKRPDQMMCASSRMMVKRRGSGRLSVAACTLLPYDSRFDLGPSLTEAPRRVMLNHRHCARFCVLGGGSCSASHG